MRRVTIACAANILAMLYALCSLLPTHRRFVCISRQSDSDPVDFQLIKEYCERREPAWEVAILAKQLRNPAAYLLEMIRQVYYIATSRATVLDSYCIVVGLLHDRIKVPVIQIWHSLGNMKRFGYTAFGTDEGHSEATARLMHMHEGYDAIAISSMSFADEFAAAFNADKSKLFEAPLPRVDLLLSEGHRTQQREAILAAYPQLHERKTIVYCPTFRKQPAANEAEAAQALIDAVDFNRFNFVYKPHPVSKQVINDPRVITIPCDQFDALFVADYIISDYSTVIYEAGLLNIPVYLYAYDWDSYREKRGLTIDFENDVPALFTGNPEEIMHAIENNDFDAQAYQTFESANVSLPEGASCTEVVCETIIEAATTRKRA
ncbi:CDP-glycerol glycerophosphotransferase family protein [Adlercreutzia sp. R25]|uniref:CDP-glycerol glycerophosphotransferase family protein n=1 Tax=Adlercreutzia shanghongiae TaxID=3111773 RepID=UPI002DB61549|nr:CDP-glycerol glycerophosphotransferase family protein [Adlercreutzia sp. R25]MEC4273422.1 CDP-glycerol glycerophosphotransferase family protein [Adlercreutzia sp. R25]